MNESCYISVEAVKRSVDYVVEHSRCLARAPTTLASVPTPKKREAGHIACLLEQTALLFV